VVIISRFKFQKNKGIRLLEKIRSRNKVVYNVGKATFFFAVRTSFFWHKTGGPGAPRKSGKPRKHVRLKRKNAAPALGLHSFATRASFEPLSFSFSRLPFRCAACDSHRVSPYSKTSRCAFYYAFASLTDGDSFHARSTAGTRARIPVAKKYYN